MKENYNLDNRQFRGGRKMVREEMVSPTENEHKNLVPVVLLPMERSILMFLAFCQDRGVTGRGLGKKMGYKAKTPAKIYKALDTLKAWGYTDFMAKGVHEEDGEGPLRHLNFITDRGIERVKNDYEGRLDWRISFEMTFPSESI